MVFSPACHITRGLPSPVCGGCERESERKSKSPAGSVIAISPVRWRGQPDARARASATASVYTSRQRRQSRVVEQLVFARGWDTPNGDPVAVVQRSPPLQYSRDEEQLWSNSSVAVRADVEQQRDGEVAIDLLTESC